MKSSEADSKIVEADLLVARSNETLFRNLLEFYIGESLNGRGLFVKGKGDSALFVKKGAVPFYADYASKAAARADVEALLNAKILAEQNFVSAQSGFFPKLTLDGNYYTRRVGFQEGNDWDVLLTLSVPVFDAGQTLGNVREAASQRDEARLRYEGSKRQASREIRDAYERLSSSLQIASVLKEAAQASKENYEIQIKEYRLSLVNNLEVLDALRRHEEIALRENQANIEAHKKAQLELHKAMVRMLGVREINLSENTLTESSQFTYARTPRFDASGQLLQGRVMEQPHIFKLVLRDKTCWLIHQNSGQQTLLVHAKCVAE
jgi:outer membrane protein TolC